MVDDLSRLYSDAVLAVRGDDPFSVLRRASLEALAAQVPELAAARPMPLTLHLVDPQARDHAVPAAQAGDVLERLQRSVARLAKARRTHALEVKRLVKADFALARLNVFAALPGSLLIELRPHVERQDDHEPDGLHLPGGTETWAEVATLELLRVLPETAEDDDAVDAIAVADPVVRRTVNDLVQYRGTPSLDVGLTLARPGGGTVQGHLSSAHARVLRRALDIASEERAVEFRRGRLDGIRTKRRIFYLDVPGGPELHGLVDDDVVPAVRENLDRVVDVRLEVVVSRTRSGRTSHRRYRLLEVANQGDLLLP